MRMVALKAIGDSIGELKPGQVFICLDPNRAETYINSGLAELEMVRETERGPEPAWNGLKWPGATVVIIASGPSLAVEDCALVRTWRDAAPDRKVIAINTSFQRAPWADVLYACDAPWWRVYYKQVVDEFSGVLWTQDLDAQRAFGINLIPSAKAEGLSKIPGVINQGANSGYQAIGLAHQAGATRIILLGYDMRGTHWHGEYSAGLHKRARFKEWIDAFDRMAPDLKAAGVAVVNCSRDTALTCFPRMPLAEVLA